MRKRNFLIRSAAFMLVLLVVEVFFAGKAIHAHFLMEQFPKIEDHVFFVGTGRTREVADRRAAFEMVRFISRSVGPSLTYRFMMKKEEMGDIINSIIDWDNSWTVKNEFQSPTGLYQTTVSAKASALYERINQNIARLAKEEENCRSWLGYVQSHNESVARGYRLAAGKLLYDEKRLNIGVAGELASEFNFFADAQSRLFDESSKGLSTYTCLSQQKRLVELEPVWRTRFPESPVLLELFRRTEERNPSQLASFRQDVIQFPNPNPFDPKVHVGKVAETYVMATIGDLRTALLALVFISLTQIVVSLWQVRSECAAVLSGLVRQS